MLRSPHPRSPSLTAVFACALAGLIAADAEARTMSQQELEALAGLDEADAVVDVEAFGLPLSDTLEPEHSVVDSLGYTVTQYRQHHAGVVVDGWVSVVSRDGVVHRVHADVVDIAAPAAPRVSRADALQRARSHVVALRPRARVPGTVDEPVRDSTATLAYDTTGRLVWRATVTESDGARRLVVVDADSAAVRSLPTSDAWTATTLRGVYKANGSSRTTNIPGETRRVGLMTKESRLGGVAPAAADFGLTKVATGYSTTAAYSAPSPVISAAGFTTLAQHGVWVTSQAALDETTAMLASAGLPLADKLIAVGVPQGLNGNQSATRYDFTYPPGYVVFPYLGWPATGTTTTSKEVAFDVIAHEVGHAAMRRGWGFPLAVDEGIAHDARALAESFADIIAVRAEYEEEGDLNWEFGEDLENLIRRLDHPAQHVASNGLAGCEYYPNCVSQPHARSGINSRFFYVLSQGNPDPAMTIAGVGFDDAWQLFQLAVLERRPAPGITYPSMAAAWEGAAKDTCGVDSQLMATTLDALRLVGFGAGYDHKVRPLHNEADVAPWATQLIFEAPYSETSWTIDIDVDPNFGSPLLQHPVAVRNGTQVYAEIDLLPAKTWYWRVRRPGAPTSGPCAPVVHSFTTGTQAPTLVAPASGARIEAWGARVAWRPVKGAVTYTVDVSDITLGLKYHQKIDATSCYPARGGDICEAFFDFAFDDVDGTWSRASVEVRAQGPSDPYDPNEGAATKRSFSIVPPVVAISSPVAGAGAAPWKLPVRVDHPGADSIAVNTEDLVTHDVQDERFFVDLDTDQALVSVPAYFTEQNRQFALWADALGPEVWPVDATVPIVQRQKSESVTLFNLGTKTMPCLLAPSDRCNGDDAVAYEHPDSSERVSWQTVDGADGYVARLYAISHDSEVSDVVWDEVVVDDPLAVGASLHARPPTGAGIYGFWVSVQARNKEIDDVSPRSGDTFQSVFHEPGEDFYLFKLPEIGTHKDQVIRRDGLVFKDENGEVVVRYEGEPLLYGPEGIRLELHAGEGCDDLDDFDMVVDGEGTYVDFHLRLEYGETYSVRARALSATAMVPEVESQCWGFTMATEEQHLCGNGDKEGSEACDDGNNLDGDSCPSDCKNPPLGCGDFAEATGDYYSQREFDLNLDPSTEAYIVYDTLTIPDSVFVYQGGAAIFDDVCVSTADEYNGAWYAPLEMNPNGGPLKVVIDPVSCAPPQGYLQEGTRWAFQIVCAGDEEATTLSPDAE